MEKQVKWFWKSCAFGLTRVNYAYNKNRLFYLWNMGHVRAEFQRSDIRESHLTKVGTPCIRRSCSCARGTLFWYPSTCILCNTCESVWLQGTLVSTSVSCGSLVSSTGPEVCDPLAEDKNNTHTPQFLPPLLAPGVLGKWSSLKMTLLNVPCFGITVL